MAFSNLIDEIERGTGKFSLDRTYFINNSTKEDIIVTWGAKEPEARGAGTYRIKAGEKGGPYPQFLAYHIVKALVNREMQRDGKVKFLGSATHRAEYENKFLIEVDSSQGDSMMDLIRKEEREKILAEMKTQPIADGQVTSSETRRKALGKKSHTDKEFEGANM